MMQFSKITKTFLLLALFFMVAPSQSFAWTRTITFEGGSVGALAQGGNGFDGGGSRVT